ncbi:hypothetical protein RHAL1_01531 [Beijerinckiaceae bacterium RH AL1]|nr:hypothetical protein [Beijerinckiaceae bacterium]VVB44973.1 hypothetical protein RHCH11_RHCH11_01494 [Beijerinckiaceae bacterium RH CH11]VVB45052.1 hypothetical protein RHAL8_01491 [Beijerinckiaceae bacterium RH AL8]VVC54632.1 hypothetical protein RHAL1_01531 [Beijerinckiaceae bacterium RH AL1]
MRRPSIAVSVLCLLVLALGGAPAAQAQAVRTWVSGVGDDANPCSRTAPCKTFAGAISKTAAAGEISVLDPGGYGAVTITKSISIVAKGIEAGITSPGIAAIVVNAGPADFVSIRGLTIEGGGTGTYGIRVLQAGSVNIADTVIKGIKGSPGFGLDIAPSAAATNLLAYVKNVEVFDNAVGIHMLGGPNAAGLVIDGSTITGNSANAAVFDGANAAARAQASSFANTPLLLTNGAKLTSNGNNFFVGGSSAPTSLSPLQ